MEIIKSLMSSLNGDPGVKLDLMKAWIATALSVEPRHELMLLFTRY